MELILRPYTDGYGRWHVIVPAGTENPREEARALMENRLAVQEWRAGETLDHASGRMASYLEASNETVMSLPPTAEGNHHFVEYLTSNEAAAAFPIETASEEENGAQS